MKKLYLITVLIYSFFSVISMSIEMSNEEFGCQLASAARLSINTGHGSCQSSKLEFDDICKFLKSSNVKGGIKQECNKRTPVYHLGKKHKILRDSLVYSAPEGKIDCSSFISGVLCRMGARLFPNDDSCGPLNTEEFMKMGESKDCFEIAEFTAVQDIKPGCLIVSRTGNSGHVLMINRAAKDPFKLNEVSSCDKVDRTTWQFDVAESLPNSALAIHQGSKKFDKSLVELAKLACKVKLSGKAEKAEISFERTKVKVLCHRNVSSCHGQIRKFKDEDCVSKCPEENRKVDIDANSLKDIYPQAIEIYPK